MHSQKRKSGLQSAPSGDDISGHERRYEQFEAEEYQRSRAQNRMSPDELHAFFRFVPSVLGRFVALRLYRGKFRHKKRGADESKRVQPKGKYITQGFAYNENRSEDDRAERVARHRHRHLNGRVERVRFEQPLFGNKARYGGAARRPLEDERGL